MTRRALPTRPARPLWPWLLLVSLFLLAGRQGYKWWNRPQDPPVKTSAQAQTLDQRWKQLAEFGARGFGTPGHDRSASWLATQLRDLGYTVNQQAVSLTLPHDQGGALVSGQTRIPVKTLYGSDSAEASGKLIRIPPDADSEQLDALGLQMNIALTRCPKSSLTDLTSRVTAAGGFGLVLVNDCQNRPFERVPKMVQPMVEITPAQAAEVEALIGKTVQLKNSVEWREAHGHNIVAHRVNAVPDIVFGAHYDSAPDSLGANSNASGVLTVLEVARQASRTPLADHAWFILFDAGEEKMLGSKSLVPEYSYTLRPTRAMLNVDGVGRNHGPLQAAAHEQLEPLLKQVRPGIQLFNEQYAEQMDALTRRSRPTIGNSDHWAFKNSKIRTVLLQRGKDPLDLTTKDRQIDLSLVQDTADFALKFAETVLKAPWTPDEPCGITGRDCD